MGLKSIIIGGEVEVEGQVVLVQEEDVAHRPPFVAGRHDDLSNIVRVVFARQSEP